MQRYVSSIDITEFSYCNLLSHTTQVLSYALLTLHDVFPLRSPYFTQTQQQEAERIRAAAAAGGNSSNGIENSASRMAALMDDLEDGETPTVYT
jgi:hypothetical protein